MDLCFSYPYTRLNHSKWFFHLIFNFEVSLIFISYLFFFILLSIHLSIYISTFFFLCNNYHNDMFSHCLTIRIIMVGLSLYKIFSCKEIFGATSMGKKKNLKKFKQWKLDEAKIISSILASFETNNGIQMRGWFKVAAKVWSYLESLPAIESWKEISN